ncbi:MAG: protein-disulfide reductase DsbD [Oceanicoccus sp.]
MRLVFLQCLLMALFLQSSGVSAQDVFDSPPRTMANALETGGLITEDEFLPVEQAYILNAEFQPDGYLRLNWQITDGYYLYRHGFGFELTDENGTVETTITIPTGLEKRDEYFGDVEVYYHNADIVLGPIPASAQLQLAVTSQGCADAGLCYPPYTQHFHLDTNQLSVSQVSSAREQLSPQNQHPDDQKTADYGSLPAMLLLALIGGAILNLMPCVFPVLSLKVLAFANDKDHSQTIHGLVYTSGVVLSFVTVAAILVSLQAAGEAIGWGFHLQSPWFVAALTYLFFVMGLSLSGFVEFGGQIMNLGGGLTQKTGYSGSFFTGVLATVVASPCTAPFMGTALGFAVTQPTFVALSVFATLGFGMALPVLLLSYSPKLLAKIPKPGPWMDQLKQLLAFPLYATAVWLCWVVGNQTGVNGMASLMLGCVLITLAIWLWRGKTVKRTIAASCVALALVILGSSLMQPKTHVADTSDQSWQPYSPEKLSELRAQEKAVFINITADWCITCLANERATLSTDTIKQAMKESGITYLKGDWTNRDRQITALLKEYGRNGIPLYIVFANNDADKGKILPQILTTETVLQAIQEATTPKVSVTLR